MPESDKILVEQIRAGDRELFGDLVERYTPLVHGVILEKIRRPDEVEDLVQETFTRAYQELSRLRDPARFGPWVARMAANRAVDWLQQQQSRHRAEEKGHFLALERRVAQPDELFESREATTVLWEALDRLAPEYRRIVVLYHLEGCTLGEIARFLGMSRATVQWRLYRARGRLQRELDDLFGQEVGSRFRRQRVRQKVMSCLPLVPFFRPPPPTWTVVWTRRLLLRLGAAGLLVPIGLGLSSRLEPPSTEGIRVRLEQVDLPEVSVQLEPQRPRAGESVRIEAVGPHLPQGETAFLHYTTNLDEPRDQVVEMRKEEGVWSTAFEIPAAATNVFFYVSADPAPLLFGRDLDTQTWRKHLQRYTQALRVHDVYGRAVRGTESALGRWKSILGQPTKEVLAHYDRELVLYPDHFEVYPDRWGVMKFQMEDLAAGHVRIQKEKAALQTRYPDDAEISWMILEDDRDVEALHTFARRFPDHKQAAAAAYRATFRPRGDLEKRTAALEQFLQNFPRSSYVDDAYRDLLYMFDKIDRARGQRLADSLISRQLVPYFDLKVERATRRESWVGPYEGALPEARAYTLRFKWYIEEGDRARALELARRLVHSGLQDPIPYVLVGRQLVEADSTRALGLEVLEAGRPWTDLDYMLTLPLFTVPSTGTIRMQDLGRSWRKQEALEWRINCLQALGVSYLDSGDCTEAVPFLREAVQLQGEYTLTAPDDRIYLQLARAGECAGDWDAAVDAYLQAVQRYYHYPEAEAALERLYLQRYGDRSLLHERLATAWVAAPDFHAVDAHGDSLRLSALRGRVVLLLWDAGSDIWLENGLEQLTSWYRCFEPRGLEILFMTSAQTISYSNDGSPPIRHRDTITALARERNDPFRMLFVDGETRRKYDKTPNKRPLFLVDRSGRLRLRQERIGPFDREGEEYDRIVVAKIEELLKEAPHETDADARMTNADISTKTGGTQK